MWTIFISLTFFVFSTCCQQITPIPSPVTNLSVGGIWDDCTQSIYYTDFLATEEQMSIFRYDYNQNKVYGAYIEGYSNPAFLIPINECNKYKNQFAVNFEHYVGVIEWDGKSQVAKNVRTLFGAEESDAKSAIMIGRQSKLGRLYVGTFHTSFCAGPRNSSFYTYSSGKGLQRIFTGSITTTGIAFNKNTGSVYHLDTCLRLITEYQGDHDGNICNGRIVYDFNKLGLVPLSLESDCKGMLYTGIYYDGSIWQINPKTASAHKIAQMPFEGIGGLVFGGRDRDILFAIAGSGIIDEYSGRIIKRTGGSSLYKITGLGRKGFKYSRLIV